MNNTLTVDRELLERVLEVLEVWSDAKSSVWGRECIESVRNLLEKQQSESTGRVFVISMAGIPALDAKTKKRLEKSARTPKQSELENVYEIIVHWDEGGGKRSRRELAQRIVDLYTRSSRREWVGLTNRDYLQILDEVMEGGDLLDICRAVGNKLKDKNT